MTTITLNCTDIAWIDVQDETIGVCVYTPDGDEELVIEDKVALELYPADDNFDWMIEAIEDTIGHNLSEADHNYLYTKLYTIIDRWSLDEEWYNEMCL